MESLVIDRETRPETILSFMGVGMRARISKLGADTIAVAPVDAEDVPQNDDDDDISAIFDDVRVDLTGHKFDRDAANDVTDDEDDEISAIFKDLLVDMTGHKFDRDLANDYD